MSSTIDTASQQYRNRPADECFPSLPALVAHAHHERQLSAERTYNLKDLHVTAESGKLELASPRGAASFTHWSFSQLARTVGAPAGYLRDELSPELAAACLNHGLQESTSGTTARLLVRGQNDRPPIVRAVSTESYGRLWDAELYSGIEHQIARHGASSGGEWGLPPTWSGEPRGAYRGDRDSFLVIVNGGSIVADPSLASMQTRATNAIAPGGNTGPVDGLFRGLLVRNSEVGASSVVIECILFRYICGNHILWGATIDRSYRRRHVGSDVARDVLREIGSIAYKWANHSAARDEAIIRGLIDREIAHTREAVIDELRAMGATKEQAEHAYDTCERTESASPRSFWGIAQGFTRDSQTDAGYQDERYQLDRLAAVVLARGAKLVAA